MDQNPLGGAESTAVSVLGNTLESMKFLDSGGLPVACQCPDCECTNTTDMLVGDSATPMCGCCLADCPHVHGPDGRRPENYQYGARWSDDDGQFVGLATEFPSLSFLAPSPDEALAGIKSLVSDVLRDMAQTGEVPPVPAE